MGTQRRQSRRSRPRRHGQFSGPVGDETMREWKRLYDERGPKALIEATSGSNNYWAGKLWSAALNEYYGPTGMHESWRNREGRPSVAAMRLPNVQEAIKSARKTISSVFAALQKSPGFFDRGAGIASEGSAAHYGDMSLGRARVVSAIASIKLHDKEIRRQARDLVAQARRRSRSV